MSTRVLGGIGLGLLVGLSACGPYVEGHSVATHTPADGGYVDPSSVRLSALAVPEGAAEVGIVQAHTVGGSIEDAAPAFREQVAQLGGDFGKINEVNTTFEMRTVTQTESYGCGTTNAPRTCTRTVTRQVELATTRLLGKAYRLGRAKPAAPPPPPAPEPAAAAPAEVAPVAAPTEVAPTAPAEASPPPSSQGTFAP